MSMEEFARAVGHRLRQLREARGWTQEQLAEKAAIGRSQICRYENGRFLPNAISLVRLADELGVTTDELVGIRPGDVFEQLEDWLLLVPSSHHGPLRRLIHSYLKTHQLGKPARSRAGPAPNHD
jgi:transcriptional regulator with XRE-family HTH domain